MNNPILNIKKDTFFSYPNKKDKDSPVLRFETSLKIFPNDFVFFVGKSGSGKSTLLEGLGLMSNTFKNKKGRILFNPENNGKEYEFCQSGNGIDADKANYLRKTYFSFIFQQNALMKNYSIKENIEFALRIKGIDYGKSLEEKIMELIGIFKIGDSVKDINQTINKLSGGEQQRVALIISVLMDAKVLFADEPTGNLDAANSANFFKILKENSQKGKTVIIVSHNLDLALNFGNVIVGIEKRKDIGVVNTSTVFYKESFKDEWKNGNNKLFSSYSLKMELEKMMLPKKRIMLSDYV